MKHPTRLYLYLVLALSVIAVCMLPAAITVIEMYK